MNQPENANPPSVHENPLHARPITPEAVWFLNLPPDEKRAVIALAKFGSASAQAAQGKLKESELYAAMMAVIPNLDDRMDGPVVYAPGVAEAIEKLEELK